MAAGAEAAVEAVSSRSLPPCLAVAELAAGSWRHPRLACPLNPTAFEVDGRIIEALQQCTAVRRDHHCGAQLVQL